MQPQDGDGDAGGDYGPDNKTVVLFEQLMDSKSLFLTATTRLCSMPLILAGLLPRPASRKVDDGASCEAKTALNLIAVLTLLEYTSEEY